VTDPAGGVRRVTDAHGSCADVRRLSAYVGWLLRRRDVRLRLTPPGPVDVALLDTLARLALHARRSGRVLQVVVEEPRLRCLAALTGLSGLIGLGDEAVEPCSEPGGQAEALEDRVAQEVVDVGDPPA
jgi:hypothetical protein